MSLRSIDTVTMLPRISDAGRIQAQPQNQTSLALHVASVTGAQKAVRDAQQVIPKSEADRAGAYGDGQGNKGGQERRRSGKPRAQPEVKRKDSGGSGHRLDVKL